MAFRFSLASAAMAESSTSTSSQVIRTPGDFLKKAIGQQVYVKLHSGTEYHGRLMCLDGYMNIALEQAEEWIEGIRHRTYGDAFIRGNNVLYIRAL